MSDLWNARAEEIDGDRAVITIWSVHPDAVELSETTVFAYRVLMDAPRPGGLSRHPSEEDEYRAPEVVRSVGLDSLRNVPFDSIDAQEDVEEGMEEDGFSSRDKEIWRSEFRNRWRQFWSDPERVPSGRLTIQVSDPQWLAGLEPGAEWDSTAF